MYRTISTRSVRDGFTFELNYQDKYPTLPAGQVVARHNGVVVLVLTFAELDEARRTAYTIDPADIPYYA